MRTRVLVAAASSAIGIALFAAFLVFGDAVARARIRLVQATIDPVVDPQRSFGALLGGHPHLSPARWDTGWGGDEHLVSAIIDLPRLDALVAELAAPLRGQVARAPAWAGIAEDRPAALRIVFRVAPDSTVQPLTVVAEHAWVVYRPEQVAEFEKALAQADATSEQRAAASRHRLVHDGDRALFDAGLEGVALAAPGLDPTASAWLAALARWR